MKIVVLDGYTLNPGDLSWDDLRRLGECAIYDRSGPEEVVPRASGAELLLSNKTVVTEDHLKKLPDLRYIGVLATGYNNIDVNAARESGIVVSNIPAYGTSSVAQMTFALLLELTQHAGHHSTTVTEKRWSQSSDFCYWDYPLVELDGLVFGLIGFGRIGRAVARLAGAFGMRVLVHTPHPPQEAEGIEFVSLNDLFERSDIVSLHCPLTPETNRLINADRLKRMKPAVFLLNTSRGPLIDEVALADALNSGQIAGAGLDVLSVEPPPQDHPLFTAKNCIITPHIAWATRAARARLLATAISNVKAFLSGQPENVVNQE